MNPDSGVGMVRASLKEEGVAEAWRGGPLWVRLCTHLRVVSNLPEVTQPGGGAGFRAGPCNTKALGLRRIGPGFPCSHTPGGTALPFKVEQRDYYLWGWKLSPQKGVSSSVQP